MILLLTSLIHGKRLNHHCLEELDKIRKERKKLIEDLDKANKQAEGILKEKVAKK